MTSYPQSRTDYPRTEILLDGVWTDVSSYVRSDSGIQITRGRQDAQSQISQQTSAFTLDNTDGRFSSRNPSSPYFGLLRNAQIRHSAGAAASDSYLQLRYDDRNEFDCAFTGDKAVLDVTGDLEIRMDLWPHTWRPASQGAGSVAMILAAKYANNGVNQRSWHLSVSTAGYLGFVWTTAGTSASGVSVSSTATIPATAGRLSIKVTLDVNNGAGGNDVKFWTAPSIDGTYTQLGSTVTTGGVTSVFASTADLMIGCGSDQPTLGSTTAFQTYGGKVYEFRLYNGIGGTLVADPKFYSQTLGVTSFSDGLGTPNTWTMFRAARVTNDRYRFWGELASLPQTWDETGRNIYVQAQAQGLLRRLSLPGAPLRSPIYRQMIQYDSLVAYWPMEDGANSDSIAAATANTRPASVASTTFGVSTSGTGGLPGAASGVQFTGTLGQINASVPDATDTGTLMYVMFVKLQTLPVTQTTFVSLFTTGTARRIEIGVKDTHPWDVNCYAADGTLLSGSSLGSVALTTPEDQWVGINLLVQQNGGNVDWSWRVYVPGSGAIVGLGPFSFAGTVGKATQVKIDGRAHVSFNDASVAHLLVANGDIGFGTDVIREAIDAYNGETAAARVDRLCTEEGVDSEIWGMWDQSAPMGYQTVATLADLLQECAATDLGQLGESRDSLAITYRTRGDIEARRDIDISYTDSILSAVPQIPDDDRDIVNDVTVSQPQGSSFRRIIDSGPLSIAAPPDGAGTYARSFTANTATADQLEDVAGRLAGLGTWDEARIPNLAVSLHRGTELPDSGSAFAQVVGLECGDTIALTGLPSPVPPDDVLLLVQGYTETLSRFLWDITYNTTPAKPLQTGVYDLPNVPGTARYDTSGSTLNTTVNSSATTIILDSTDTDDTWTVDSSMYPFDIVIEGERITLTAAPGGSTSPQTFTSCTRSVNGVTKSHTAGAAVSLAEPFFYG